MPRYPFIIIRNPLCFGGGVSGRVVSRHKSLSAAVAARLRANRDCRRANGQNTWLDLEVCKADRDWDVGSMGSGDEISAESMADAYDSIGVWR